MGRGAEAPWMRPQRRKASQREGEEREARSPEQPHLGNPAPLQALFRAHQTPNPESERWKERRREGGRERKKKASANLGKEKRPPPTCGSPNWSLCQSLTLPASPPPGGHQPPAAPLPPLWLEREAEQEMGQVVAPPPPPQPQPRTRPRRRSSRRCRSRQGRKSRPPGKRGWRCERSSNYCLWLIFSKVDAKVGKAKSEPGSTTRSGAAPNVTPARSSGMGQRRV